MVYKPTALDDVDPNSDILREGSSDGSRRSSHSRDLTPPFDWRNATEHGFVAYVYTRDLAKGFACAAEIEAGMIGLN